MGLIELVKNMDYGMITTGAGLGYIAVKATQGIAKKLSKNPEKYDGTLIDQLYIAAGMVGGGAMFLNMVGGGDWVYDHGAVASVAGGLCFGLFSTALFDLRKYDLKRRAEKLRNRANAEGLENIVK